MTDETPGQDASHEQAQGQDKLLNCVDCGAQFVFSARDQMFYQEKNYQAPRRCRACREKRKSGQVPTMGGKRGGGGGGGDGQPGGGFGGETREQFKVVCSGCGVETTVPFKPNPNRPVYCRTCYQSRRKGGGGPDA